MRGFAHERRRRSSSASERGAAARPLLASFAAFAALAGALASCASIGGLDEFTSVDCVGASCDGGSATTPETGADAANGADAATSEDTGADAGADASGDGAKVTFATIGGTVSGLQGTGLVLRNNGADPLQIATDGPFTFPAQVRGGDPYAVTVSSQPSAQTCAVAKGSGVAGSANVTDVAVTCSTSAFSLGGTVVGLNGASGLVLTNNGGDDLAIPSAGGSFAFNTKLPSGAPFDVAVKTQPLGGASCQVSGGIGTMGAANVTSVVVNCTPGTFTVGGTVTGLAVGGTLVVQNNLGPDLAIVNTGNTGQPIAFTFLQPLASSATYSVTVKTQPTYPPNVQSCVVASGAGVIGSANVNGVAITCTTSSFTVGGSVTGLTPGSTLVLKNNGGDSLSVTASGSFQFPALASGTSYDVTVGTQPSGQTCTVSNGGGKVTSANVTSVSVSCSSTNDAGTGGVGVLCSGGITCPIGKECCWDVSVGSGVCTKSGSCPNSALACDDAFDCGGGYCCARFKSSGDTNGSLCVAAPMDCTPPANGSTELWCDPDAGTGCPAGKTCTGTSKIALYHTCQ